MVITCDTTFGRRGGVAARILVLDWCSWEQSWSLGRGSGEGTCRLMRGGDPPHPTPPSYALMHTNWQMSVLAAENGAQLWVWGNIKTQLWADINIVEGSRGEGTKKESGGGADPHCWVTAACSPSLRLPFRILCLNTGTLLLKCYVPMDKSLL